MHIGPHKTGTTAIQAALHHARPELAAHGVRYAGPGPQPWTAAMSVAGRPGHTGRRRYGIEHWERLVEEVRSYGQDRVVISSEAFSEATDLEARRVVDDLGGQRVHVVVTLRPLSKILPSQWQQLVRNRVRQAYPAWLESVFNGPPEVRGTALFWVRHRHDELVARWAGVVGAENVTVVMVDETDRDQLLRVFERFIGLPGGLLAQPPRSDNRSLTHGEVELVRQLNVEFRRRRVSDARYQKLVSFSLVPAMQHRRPEPGEPRTVTPQWALDRAAQRGADAAAAITALGVRVVGNIADLGAVEPPASRPTGADDVPVVPSRAVAEAFMACLVVAARGEPELVGDVPNRARLVRELSAGELARVIAGRARRRVRRSIRDRRDGRP